MFGRFLRNTTPQDFFHWPVNLAWIFYSFCARVFVLFSDIKRESSPILRDFRTKYFGRIYVQDFIPESPKWISRKILKNHQIFDLESYLAKLECIDIDYIRAIQKLIQNPVKHLRWSVLWKWWTPFSCYFRKMVHLRFLRLFWVTCLH